MEPNANGNSEGLNRRGFLQAGGVAATAITGAFAGRDAIAAQAKGEKAKGDAKAVATARKLPTRTLGKTGVDVTMLNIGTWQNPGTDRLIRFAYASGVRVFDTADCYGSEPAFNRWFQAAPEVRKNIFLVTKDHPRQGPKQLIGLLDKRLETLGTDYVDLFFIHGIGPGDYGKESLNWPKSKEFREVAETIKKSGKARFVGFSCHDRLRAEYLQAAADGGFVDAIMLQYTPWIPKDSPLNKALDACHEKGIGLISMKQITGASDKILKEVPKRAPSLIEKGLTAYQALLHAIWTDERISMSCVSMKNVEQIRMNTDAALRYEPLKAAEIESLRDAYLAAGPTFCADCDGRCGRAAGTEASLGDLTRLLTYHDQYGSRREAKRLYAELSESDRDWTGADLEAARAACHNNLDFANLLPRAVRVLS